MPFTWEILFDTGLFEIPIKQSTVTYTTQHHAEYALMQAILDGYDIPDGVGQVRKYIMDTELHAFQELVLQPAEEIFMRFCVIRIVLVFGMFFRFCRRRPTLRCRGKDESCVCQSFVFVLMTGTVI